MRFHWFHEVTATHRISVLVRAETRADGILLASEELSRSVIEIEGAVDKWVELDETTGPAAVIFCDVQDIA